MKKILFLHAALCLICLRSFSQSVGINYTAASPNSSALLDVDADAGIKKGILIPRVALTSSTDAATILSPANSLLVYNLGTGGLAPASYYWNSGTSTSPVWVPFVNGGAAATAWMLTGNTGTAAGANFIGTTDNVDLVFKTYGSEKMRILPNGYVGIGTSTITPTTVLVVSSEGNGNAAGSPSIIVRGKDNKERIQLESYGTSPGPVYNGVGARGPVEAPTQTLLDDIIVGLGGRGYDNTGTISGNTGLLLIKAAENFSTSAQGTYFSFNTTKAGGISRTEKMRLSSAGFLGIGTTAPQVELHVLSTLPTSTGNLHPYRTGALVEGDNGTFGGRIAIRQAGRNAALTLYRTNGTISSPSPLITGDTMAVISFGGWDGSSVNSFYGISAIATQTWTSGHGASLTFNTPNNNSGWGGTEKMRITSEGDVGIGTNSPLGKLHAYGDIYAGTGTTTYPSTPAGSHSNIILKGNGIDARLVMNDGTGSFQQYLNSYYDGSVHKYTTSTLATRFTASAGTFGFYVAPSGTAGNTITWTTGLFIDNSGNVGVGCSAPQYKLHVVGNAGVSGTIVAGGTITASTGVTACSDMRYKKNIAPLPNALGHIMKLQGVNYFWKKEEFPAKMFNDKKQIGFIAQEIEKIYPELVFTDDDGYKSVDYSRLTPILVEALKEQQTIIQRQQGDIEKLAAENQATNKRLEKVEALIGASSMK